MPVTPLGIWTPSDSDDWDLTVDLSAMALSIDTAITTAVSGVTNGVAKQFRGPAASRPSVTGMSSGDTYQETDGSFFRWVYRGTTWFLAPGQLLAFMRGPNSTTLGVAGTQVGTTVSTPVLPIGQNVKISTSVSPFNSAAAGSGLLNTSWRNSPTDVSYTTRDGYQEFRAYSGAGGVVNSSTSGVLIATTTVNAKISAAIYIDGPNTGNYGADGTFLTIESA